MSKIELVFRWLAGLPITCVKCHTKTIPTRDDVTEGSVICHGCVAAQVFKLADNFALARTLSLFNQYVHPGTRAEDLAEELQEDMYAAVGHDVLLSEMVDPATTEIRFYGLWVWGEHLKLHVHIPVQPKMLGGMINDLKTTHLVVLV